MKGALPCTGDYKRGIESGEDGFSKNLKVGPHEIVILPKTLCSPSIDSKFLADQDKC